MIDKREAVERQRAVVEVVEALKRWREDLTEAMGILDVARASVAPGRSTLTAEEHRVVVMMLHARDYLSGQHSAGILATAFRPLAFYTQATTTDGGEKTAPAAGRGAELLSKLADLLHGAHDMHVWSPGEHPAGECEYCTAVREAREYLKGDR